MLSCRFLCLSAAIAVALSGCASGTNPGAAVLAAVLSDKLGGVDPLAIPSNPNPAYRYLRVEVAGRSAALLVLGYLDSDAQGEIEVWYSARQEVIKTQNGRIVGTAGLELDWRGFRYTSAPPAWTAVPTEGSTYERSRDVFPGYRYGISERIALKPWANMPPVTLSAALPPDLAQRQKWFRESVVGSATSALPPAWFAWGVHQGQATVVYSEQCLSASLCLRLLRWPLPDQTP